MKYRKYRLQVVWILVAMAVCVTPSVAESEEYTKKLVNEYADVCQTSKECKALAQGGNVKAQVTLGTLYERGSMVPQDHVKAIKWYRKAAEDGDAGARMLLAGLYEQGKGVPQDYEKAVKWYRRGAEEGQAFLQFGLGGMYYRGKGVQQNYEEAYFWLNLAASKMGEKKVYEMRNIVAEKLGPEALNRAQKRAREWSPKTEDKEFRLLNRP